MLVSVSLATVSEDFILPNIILGISSLPSRTIPCRFLYSNVHLFHWFVTQLPLACVGPSVQPRREILILLYPLHVYTVRTIDFLTTTSLDPSEQQLLAAALIDLYLFAETPQSQILKALLWLGNTLIFVTCQRPLQWELALARTPPWRLRVSNRRPRSKHSLLERADRTLCSTLLRLMKGYRSKQACDSEDDEKNEKSFRKGKHSSNLSVAIDRLIRSPTTTFLDHISTPSVGSNLDVQKFNVVGQRRPNHDHIPQRRHTLPASESTSLQTLKTTPSGRSKRSVNLDSHPLLAMTPAQAAVRKWIYAASVYVAVFCIILGPIRLYVSHFSLAGAEPFGWALGYLLGDVPQFRFWVLSRGLDGWISLPNSSVWIPLVPLGWIEQTRQQNLGQANTRLLLCVYCLAILLAGMAALLQLSSIVEVDTRRKVFHGVMVAMLLPTVFVDPCFTSLALILILAIFLLLDLFRACQLPPISKPLTAFLAPYVDGRDHRGPVIVSHIFLLIGCAIPLWLSLVASPRGGHNPWAGWDVAVPDISMISGVVCVGMGDSAASLIGRRYGRHKWYWGGGKSLEGSLAFTVAVTLGILTAYLWLRVGGWVAYDSSWQTSINVLGKAWLAASGASLTEAALTGANDNVIVPVVLWLLVKGLKI